MSDFWKSIASAEGASAELTREDLERTIKAMMKPPPPHRHLTSASALRRVKREGGCLRCVECLAVICTDG